MTSERLWQNYWNNGINDFTLSYRNRLVFVDNVLPLLQNAMFSAFDAEFSRLRPDTFSTGWQIFGELFLSSFTSAAAVASAMSVAWGFLAMAFLYALRPGSQQPSNLSFFSFFHYPTTPTTILSFSLSLAMLSCGVLLLPGPTVLSGLSCIFLALSWLYLLREPKSLQEAFVGGGSGEAKRVRMVATAASVVSVLQFFLSFFFVWQAVNIGTSAVSPPQRSSILITLPAVPGIAAARGQIGVFMPSGNLVVNMNNIFPSGTFSNAGGGGAATDFGPATMGTNFFGNVNCVAASAVMTNSRVRLLLPFICTPPFMARLSASNHFLPPPPHPPPHTLHPFPDV
jgi:hypothetical protein